jgi:hypothetical protein
VAEVYPFQSKETTEQIKNTYGALIDSVSDELRKLPLALRGQVTSVRFDLYLNPPPSEAALERGPMFVLTVGRPLDDETLPITLKEDFAGNHDKASVGIRPNGTLAESGPAPKIFMNFAEEMERNVALLKEADVTASLAMRLYR